MLAPLSGNGAYFDSRDQMDRLAGPILEQAGNIFQRATGRSLDFNDQSAGRGTEPPLSASQGSLPAP